MAYTAADIILMCVGSIAPSTLKIPCRQTVGDCLCKHALVLPSWREGLFLVSVLTQTEVMNTRGMRWKTIVKASRQNQKNINNLFIWQTLLSRVIWHIILTNNIRRILQLCSSSRFSFFTRVRPKDISPQEEYVLKLTTRPRLSIQRGRMKRWSKILKIAAKMLWTLYSDLKAFHQYFMASWRGICRIRRI